MNRRRFLMGALAAVAPAIVRADSLMRIVPRDTSIFQAVTTGRDVVDDYEEGIWIPTLTGEMNAEGVFTYRRTGALITVSGKIIREGVDLRTIDRVWSTVGLTTAK